MTESLRPAAAVPEGPTTRAKPPAGNGKNSSRRRTQPKQSPHGGRRFAAVILFLLTLLAVAPPRALQPVAHQEGAFAGESVIAEVAFEVENLAATENARRRAANAAPYLYLVDSELVDERLSALVGVFDAVEQIVEKAVLSPDERRRLLTISVKPTLSEVTAGLLIQPENLAALRNETMGLVTQTLERGVFTDQPLLSAQVELVHVNGDREALARENVPRLARVTRDLEEACRAEAGDNAIRAAALFELASFALGSTVQFDEPGTKALQAAARQAVPRVMRTIHRNELIVQAGHRVTPQDVTELRAYARAIREGSQLTTYVGHALSVFLLLLGGIALLRIAEPDVLASGRQVWLLTVVGLVVVGVARILVMASLGPEYRVLVPVAPAAVILTVLLNWRVALTVAVFTALAVARMPEYGSAFMLQAIVSAVIGVTTIGRVRKRIDFLRPGISVGTTCAAMSVATGLVQDAGPQTLALVFGFGLANGLIVAFVAPGLLTPLERLARVTTDVTLLEFGDLKHPLLVRMQQEAPGTFHHSLTMATLSEAAAEAIGANPLLARVGCYFHDIGKMVKPEYFAENQYGENAHDKITPQMSALILTAHVKEGMELGRQHGLAEPILAFIPEHQGTAIMVHFYKKALEQAPEGTTVDENDYRYPGPRSQSKETAICMVADSVEAASRTLQEPTPARIQSMVYKIANGKFLDGQLDDCDLTLRDLNRICAAFTRVLAAMLHTRVAYPAEQTPKEIKQKVAGGDSQPESTEGLAIPAPAKSA